MEQYESGLAATVAKQQSDNPARDRLKAFVQDFLGLGAKQAKLDEANGGKVPSGGTLAENSIYKIDADGNKRKVSKP